MLDRLKGEPRLELFSDNGGNQSGVLSLRCRGIDSETLAARLGERGICVRGGMHCAPCAHASAGTQPDGTVRFSFSPFTTEEQVLTACDCLLDVLD
jgi:selenocysteine lyase/cysteine desulfurase